MMPDDWILIITVFLLCVIFALGCDVILNWFEEEWKKRR
jgi:hypothetical protein